jgi:cytochrome c-type biogenesis protein
VFVTWGWLEIGSAVWLGILTSISPCPLASNIAAISFIGRRVGKPRLVLLAGLLYALGRSLVYVTIAIVVSRSLQMIPGVSLFLQKYMNLAVGPLLLIVGVLLLGILNISFGGGSKESNLQLKVERMGIWGAGLLGAVFALAFCPVSAGLFFGALIPLAIKSNAVLMSLLYGIGTALPVIGFSLLIAFAAHMIGAAFKKLTVVEIWVRRVTAVVMLCIGIYLILHYNFRITF